MLKELNDRSQLKGEITLSIGKFEGTRQSVTRVNVGLRVQQMMSEEGS